MRKKALIFIIILCAVLPYLNTLNANFVWDDEVQLVQNPYMQSFKYLKDFFTHDFWHVGINKLDTAYYRPLFAANLMSQYVLWGKNPFGYHLINILLHCLITLLIFKILLLLTSDEIISFTASLIFAVHPIHTESVSFIAAIVDLQTFIFMLLTFLCYILYQRNSRKILLVTGAVSFVAGLLTKEMAVITPFLILIKDVFIPKENNKKQNIVAYFIFFLILAAYLMFRVHLFGIKPNDGNLVSSNFIPGNTPYWRFLTVPAIIARYIGLLFIPYNMTADYLFKANNSIWNIYVISGMLIILLCIFVIIFLRKKQALLSFAIAWFALTILPVSNIFPQGNIFAERFLYIPSLGFCILMAVVFSYFPKRPLVTCLFYCWIISMGRLTWERNIVWKNDLNLWIDTVSKVPNSPRAHLNLAEQYFLYGKTNEAILELDTAIKILPNYKQAYNGLGLVLYKTGDINAAIAAYQKAIAIDPKYNEAYNNMAAALIENKQYKEAINALEIAINYNPYLTFAYYNLGQAYDKLGIPDKAIAAYEKFIAIKPEYAVIYADMGRLYYQEGNTKKAKECCLKALELAPGHMPAQEIIDKIRD
jgi:tetratricopeptide (TPR) repeat protein